MAIKILCWAHTNTLAAEHEAHWIQRKRKFLTMLQIEVSDIALFDLHRII